MNQTITAWVPTVDLSGHHVLSYTDGVAFGIALIITTGLFIFAYKTKRGPFQTETEDKHESK